MEGQVHSFCVPKETEVNDGGVYLAGLPEYIGHMRHSAQMAYDAADMARARGDMMHADAQARHAVNCYREAGLV